MNGAQQPAREILTEVAAAVRANDMARAVRLAETALNGGAEHPLLLNLRAFRLEQEGRLDAALACLESARELAPIDAAVLNALGLCRGRLHRLTEALEAFDAAIDAEPQLAHLHANRARTYELLGEVDQARASFERAVQLDPTLADVMAALASLAARRGDAVSAQAWAARALVIRPESTGATEALAQAALLEGRNVEAERLLTDLLKRPDLAPAQSAIVRGLLGDALDAQGETARAFAAYARANADLRSLHAKRFGDWADQTAREQVESFISHLAQANTSSWRNIPGEDETRGRAAVHVFLLGFPRSGTTLLERALARHPGAVTLEEKDVLGEAVGAFLRDKSTLDKLGELAPADAAHHRQLYWDKVISYAPEVAGKVLVDKLPLNLVRLPLIAKLFPHARILMARRDPRDVVFSCFRRRFLMNPSMYEFLTLEGAARFYDSAMRFAAVCQDKLALNVHIASHEETVRDFKTSVGAVCEFVGLSWDDDLRHFGEKSLVGASATPSSAQVARGLYSDGVGQWRRYRTELAPIMPILHPWVTRFGYS